MADKVKVTLIKSTIGAVPKNKKTIEALGLNKLGKTVEFQTMQLPEEWFAGRHLVKVEEEA